MFILQFGNGLEDVGVVRVEALDEVDLELYLLQLVAVCQVLLALQFVAHGRQSVHEQLAFAVSLRLS